MKITKNIIDDRGLKRLILTHLNNPSLNLNKNTLIITKGVFMDDVVLSLLASITNIDLRTLISGELNSQECILLKTAADNIAYLNFYIGGDDEDNDILLRITEITEKTQKDTATLCLL